MLSDDGSDASFSGHPAGSSAGSARTRPLYDAEVTRKGAEKELPKDEDSMTVLKLTQVGEESILRRSRKLSLRN